MLQTTTEVKTMSSTEIVKIINDMREDGTAELRHDNFMVKVVTVLGAEVALKFQGYYKAANGKQNPCYYLPKREANLMVMSESYKVQAAVYDKMVELETQQVRPLSQLEILGQSVQILTEHDKRLTAAEVEVKHISAKVADLQVNLRNGVPEGYVSKANALRLYGCGLSKAIFEAVMTENDVKTQPYVHYAEGHSVATFGYLENVIPGVVESFIASLEQATTNQCYSPTLNKRLTYRKPTLQ